MSKQKQVYKIVAELAARLGMSAPDVVFNNTPHFYIGSALGRCFRKQGVIGVRIRGLGLKAIRHTVAHELIHMRFPNLPHGMGFEQHINALQSGFMLFDGKGLVTKVKKPAPTISDEAAKLLERQKRLDTRIKRLMTARKKIVRRLNFLKRKEDAAP